MYPTLFTIPFLPAGWGEVKSYGFMLMIGFLSAIWLACRRAERVRADPDVVLNIGLISLVAGVIGARAYFVWHYWEDQFANQPNPWLSVAAINRGGLEFWGGPILSIPAVMIYLMLKKQSIRWYIDIVAPSLMWGLAFGRIGCLLNGCCWGGVCVDPHDRSRAGLPWAIRFPYDSPAMRQQYWIRQLTIPKELIYISPTGESLPLAREWIDAAAHDKTYAQARDALRDARRQLASLHQSHADAGAIQAQESAVAAAAKRLQEIEGAGSGINEVMKACRRFNTDPADLAELAAHYRSLPIHPTQPYEMISAFMLSWLLGTMFFRRARHGIVFGWMILLYSVLRFLLECIRQDNPLDVANLTLSQSVCVVMFVFALVYFAVIYRLPVKSPAAQPFYWPEEPAAVARPAKA